MYSCGMIYHVCMVMGQHRDSVHLFLAQSMQQYDQRKKEEVGKNCMRQRQKR